MKIGRIPYVLSAVSGVLVLALLAVAREQEQKSQITFESQGLMRSSTSQYISPSRQGAYSVSFPAMLVVNAVASSESRVIRDRSFVICTAILWFAIGVVFRRIWHSIGTKGRISVLIALGAAYLSAVVIAVEFIAGIHYPLLFGSAVVWVLFLLILVVGRSGQFFKRRVAQT